MGEVGRGQIRPFEDRETCRSRGACSASRATRQPSSVTAWPVCFTRRPCCGCCVTTRSCQLIEIEGAAEEADDYAWHADVARIEPGDFSDREFGANGRLEHLRGSVLGFRNLTNYIARSLLDSGGFRPRLHPGL